MLPWCTSTRNGSPRRQIAFSSAGSKRSESHAPFGTVSAGVLSPRYWPRPEATSSSTKEGGSVAVGVAVTVGDAVAVSVVGAVAVALGTVVCVDVAVAVGSKGAVAVAATLVGVAVGRLW